MRLFGILLFCIATTVLSELTIDIFVESQCPYCINFINTSLKRALATKDLEKIVKLQIFPYGNAKYTENTQSGTFNFTCQHGAVECYGNKLEVCGINKINNGFDKVRFVQCIEGQVTTGATQAQFDQAAEFCSPQFGINIQELEACTRGNEGDLLQKQVADITNNLIPAHKYVPWIVANGNYDETAEGSIQVDLVKWACKNYQGDETIEACQ